MSDVYVTTTQIFKKKPVNSLILKPPDLNMDVMMFQGILTKIPESIIFKDNVVVFVNWITVLNIIQIFEITLQIMFFVQNSLLMYMFT